MGVLKDFGRSENDLGSWFPFGEDAPFEIRVRRVPYDVAQRINKRYGRETMVVVDGIKRPHIERNLEEQTNWLLDQAAWAWSDAKGLQIEVGDEEGARLWTGLLKREVSVGDVLDLSGGDLNDAVKKRILTQVRPYAKVTDAESNRPERHDIASFIVLKAALLQAESAKEEEARRGN